MDGARRKNHEITKIHKGNMIYIHLYVDVSY